MRIVGFLDIGTGVPMYTDCTVLTWHSVDCNPPLLKKLSLLASTAKNEGIPSLESEDCGSLASELAKECMNLFLCPCVEPSLLPNIYHPCPRMYEPQYLC